MREFVIAVCAILAHVGLYAQSAGSDDWIQLFNGKDLKGWTPKFTGYPLGVNHLNTFRVEDGLFKVSYDNWSDFSNEFGHILRTAFFALPAAGRIISIYRRAGDQRPGWAFPNNGIMFHSQSPESMTLDQEFPASIEAQMLGGNGSDTRPTANVCSPGTHYVMNDELITVHCTNSVSETYHGDQWVVMELERRAVNPSDTLSMGILFLSIRRCSSILVIQMRSDLLRRVHQYRSTVDISLCRQRATRLRSEPLSFLPLDQ